LVICPRLFFCHFAITFSGIHPFTWQVGLWKFLADVELWWIVYPLKCINLNAQPLQDRKSCCVVFRDIAVSNAVICIARFLMGKPHLCSSTSSRTFSLVTLKFHCLETLFFLLEFCLFNNCYIFFSVIHSALQHAVSVLQCCCWFLCTLFYLVKSASYLRHIGVGIVDTVAHFPSTGSPMVQHTESNLFHESDFRWDVGILIVKLEV